MILQLGKNPHYKTVRAVGHTQQDRRHWPAHPVTGTLTGSPIRTNLFTDDTSHYFTDRNLRRRHKSHSTSGRTQLYLHFTLLFNEDYTFHVFLLQLTNSDLKLSTPDGCSSNDTEGVPSTNQRLRRQYSLLNRENSCSYSQSVILDTLCVYLWRRCYASYTP